MWPISLDEPVVAALLAQACGDQKAQQPLLRARVLLDTLTLAGPRLDGPQVKYRETAGQLLMQLRPSPHDVLFVVPGQPGYRVVAVATYQTERELKQGVQTALQAQTARHRPRMAWAQVRSQLPPAEPAAAMVLDALAQLIGRRFLQGVDVPTLAARLAVSPAQVAKIERIDARPTLATLQRYAQALELTLELNVR
ncbi:helix-turn-helix domain-containing protein [Lacticaseibacillus daqingensis]|uniref:helix-turn-helix domain-containing protein n=1 Tax=Lacticaseibacillus daqingensis TaxID=2486014 RepID=UPI000F76C1ED|nr:helix-turn-helix transcriptional regulator [Lacticaseibacillus daqingensis]